MSLLTILKNQHGQSPFWGALMGGFTRGLEQVEERKRRRSQLDLEKQRIDLERKRFDLEDKMTRQRMDELARQVKARGAFAERLRGPSLEAPPQTSGILQEEPERKSLREEMIGGTPFEIGQTPATEQNKMLADIVEMGGNVPASVFTQTAQQQKPFGVGPNVYDPQTRQFYTPPQAPPPQITPYQERSLSVQERNLEENRKLRQQQQAQMEAYRRAQLAQGQQRLDLAKEKPSQVDVGPTITVKDAAAQLSTLAGSFRKPIEHKAELEAAANSMGYTIKAITPGMFGFNFVLAPITKGQRAQAQQGAAGGKEELQILSVKPLAPRK